MYQQTISHLEGLHAYPGGEDTIAELVSYWYSHHKNRPAMKDELRKAGYPKTE